MKYFDRIILFIWNPICQDNMETLNSIPIYFNKFFFFHFRIEYHIIYSLRSSHIFFIYMYHIQF